MRYFKSDAVVEARKVVSVGNYPSVGADPMANNVGQPALHYVRLEDGTELRLMQCELEFHVPAVGDYYVTYGNNLEVRYIPSARFEKMYVKDYVQERYDKLLTEDDGK